MGSRPNVSGLRYLSATTLPGLAENTKVNVRARRLGSTEWLSRTGPRPPMEDESHKGADRSTLSDMECGASALNNSSVNLIRVSGAKKRFPERKV